MAQKREKKRGGILAPLLILIALILVCVQCFRLQGKIAEARAERETAQAQIRELEQKNAELEDALERMNDPEYLEELARDQLGYVSPGQKDFYDVSN